MLACIITPTMTAGEAALNRIERFRAVLREEPVDRVPAGFWFHFDAPYHGGAAMAQAHLDYYRATDADIVKVMNDTGYAPIGRVIIAAPRDWRTLEPTPLSDPLFQSHLEGLRRIVDAVGHEAPIMTTCFNPFHEAVAMLRASQPLASGSELDARLAWVRQLRADPEAVCQGMRIITDDLARFYRACVREAGVGGIYFSAQGGEASLMTEAEHALGVKAYDLALLGEINQVAEFTVGHFCGRGLALARYAAYPVSLVNWAHHADNLSLREGRALFGKPILGGLDERGPLVTGPREALRREVRAAWEALGSRGFMLGAGCTVPGDIDLAQLIAAREEIAALSAV
jgi:uroporphyrinogen decarboxylase